MTARNQSLPFLQLAVEAERVGFEVLREEVEEKKRTEILANVAKACSAGAQMTLVMGGAALLFRCSHVVVQLGVATFLNCGCRAARWYQALRNRACARLVFAVGIFRLQHPRDCIQYTGLPVSTAFVEGEVRSNTGQLIRV